MRRIPCASLLPKNGTNLTAAPNLPSRSHAAKLINTGLPLPKLTMPSATGTWFVPARAGSKMKVKRLVANKSNLPKSYF